MLLELPLVRLDKIIRSCSSRNYPVFTRLTSTTPFIPSMFLRILFRCSTSLMSIVKFSVACRSSPVITSACVIFASAALIDDDTLARRPGLSWDFTDILTAWAAVCKISPETSTSLSLSNVKLPHVRAVGRMNRYAIPPSTRDKADNFVAWYRITALG